MLDPVLQKAIKHLKDRLQLVEEVLEALERSQKAAKKSRRGRKSMGAAEREVVSARLKSYWAGRRKQRRLNEDEG
jgi:hypothetical protein